MVSNIIHYMMIFWGMFQASKLYWSCNRFKSIFDIEDTSKCPEIRYRTPAVHVKFDASPDSRCFRFLGFWIFQKFICDLFQKHLRKFFSTFLLKFFFSKRTFFRNVIFPEVLPWFFFIWNFSRNLSRNCYGNFPEIIQRIFQEVPPQILPEIPLENLPEVPPEMVPKFHTWFLLEVHLGNFPEFLSEVDSQVSSEIHPKFSYWYSSYSSSGKLHMRCQ